VRSCGIRAVSQKDIGLVVGNAMPDPIPMLSSVLPRYSLTMAIGSLEGRSATRIHRELLHTRRTLSSRSLWAPGHCVSTVGPDEVQIDGTSVITKSSGGIVIKVS
jgi:REP element-mobilizing transposase RayT